MNGEIYNNYVEILRTELIPALGCTEPIALAYASAQAVEVLGDFPESIKALCSGNIIKNVKGVKGSQFRRFKRGRSRRHPGSAGRRCRS